DVGHRRCVRYRDLPHFGALRRVETPSLVPRPALMVSPELLAILRCPLSPSKTKLVLEDNHLICERCYLKFKIKDGFPVLVAEEAKVPPGCESLGQLPCQLEGQKSIGPGEP